MAVLLSDEELRQQLLALGEKNIGPITSTTRALYVKKLDKLTGSQQRSGRGRTRPLQSRKLVGLSSDESEGDEPTAQVASRSRARPSPGRTTRRSSRGAEDAAAEPVSRPAPRMPLRTRRSNYGTGDNREAEQSGRSGASSRGLLSRSRPPPEEDDLEDEPDGFQSSDTDGEFDQSLDSPISRDTSTVNRSINTSAHLNDSRFWNHSSQPNSTNHEGSISRKSPGSSAPKSSSTLSNRRNPSSRNKNRRSNVVYVSNHNSLSANHKDSTLLEEDKILKSGFKTKEEPQSKCSQYVSMVLVALIILFFAVLTFIYMGMKPEGVVSQVTSSDDDWMLCPNNVKKSDCFTHAEAAGLRKVILVLDSCLNTAAVDHYCGDRASDQVPYTDLLKLLKNEMGSSIASPELTTRLKGVCQLILRNPQWDIKLYDASGTVTTDPLNVESLARSAPCLPLICRLRRSATKVVVGIACIIFALILGIVIWKCLHVHWSRQKKETEQVYRVVEQIIDILKSHSDNCKDTDDAYLAIPHVRDMLIPFKDRKRLQPLWEKARKFLSANESRVREETQKIAGEEFIVWRWLQMCPNGNKVWQGKAFGETGPCYSPTQCLKVRNMFDPDMECEENWHIPIQDAILEKCGDRNGIVHIAVDTSSQEVHIDDKSTLDQGCVYIKFDSADSAGNGYKSLHGWYFDRKLVTVKYLRLERYHERFPGAATCTRPMRPSNDQQLSLSQPFYDSIIERS